ncbi:cytochrome P450 [Echria macrotheca]|uniref:Cytochrome P450 n=1 Tax=Echria macrotheca TaxID=438768 RepID=A0AAJ0BIP7_9PEZI|nr:cytochrome P450 [Echria macrotheca]
MGLAEGDRAYRKLCYKKRKLDNNNLTPESFKRRPDTDANKHNKLNQTMKSRHLHTIAIGGSIGAGLFVGTGSALRKVPPAESRALIYRLIRGLDMIALRIRVRRGSWCGSSSLGSTSATSTCWSDTSSTLLPLSTASTTPASWLSWSHLAIQTPTSRRITKPHGKEVDMTAIPAKDLLDKLPYMTAVINETLHVRVAPVIPLNERVAVRNTVLPRRGAPDGSIPVFVPEGRQVLIATYAMARREDIWGWDADEFRPERWGPGRVLIATYAMARREDLWNTDL